MNYIKILKTLSVLVLICFTRYTAYSQANAQCGNATPFCTGVPVQYPAATNAGSAPTGPAYGCLGSEPNPAFFFLQMSSAGPVSISMSAANDIDFICWGPFTNILNVCSSLTSTLIQSCSYSPSNTETCTISNAVAGAFYVMLITNYSNSTQNISFNQTNNNTPGAGTTNCGVVCGITLNNSGPVCAGNSNTLTATTGTSINSYTLNGPLGTISSGTLAPANNTLTNVLSNLTSSSGYTFIAATSASTCQTTSSVSVIQYPSYSVTPSTPQICQGGNFNTCVVFSGSVVPTDYQYYWSGAISSGSFATSIPGTGIFSPGNQCTPIAPSNITTSVATVLYHVVVTPTALNCPISNTVLLTINNPLTPTLTIPATICNTTSPVSFSAVPLGGIWSGNGIVNSSTGLFNPSATSTAMPTNTVAYSVNVGTCNVTNTGTVIVSQFHSTNLTSGVSTLCVNDPQFNLMSIVQDTSGYWFGSNVSYGKSFAPTGLSTGTYALTYSTQSTPIASVCPSSTVLIVSVYSPKTPSVNPIAPRCSNAGTVQLTASPSTNLLWTGNSGVSSTGVVSPSACTAGANNIVFCTNGIGTCVATAPPFSFEIDAFHTAALTGSVSQLCSNSNPFNLLSISQDTNGSWTGPQPFTQNNIFHPANIITGTYTFVYTNYATLGTSTTGICTDTRTIQIAALNPPPASIKQIGPICNNGSAIQLTVTPNTGAWVPSQYLTANGIFTPSLSPVGNNMIQYVIGTSTCNTQQTASISVEEFVPATITGSIADQCSTGSPVNLQPYTLNNLGVWSGSGVLGTSFNPATAGTGTISLIYNTASSSGLCPDRDTVSVAVYSLATPVLGQAGPFCTSSAPVQLNVNPVGGTFGGANTQAVNAYGLFNPAAAVVGSNIVNYSITAGPCLAYSQTTISIEKFVSAALTGIPGPFCKNDPRLLFNLNSVAENPGGLWQGAGVNGSLFTFTNANIGDNNIIYHLTASVPTSTLCPDVSSVQVIVYDTPQIQISSDKYQGCAPVQVQLNYPNVNSGEGLWYLGDGSQPIPGLVINHTFNSPGTYSVVFNYSLSVTSDLACVAQATITNPIKVFENPLPDFILPEEVMISAPSVQIENTTASVTHNRYQWTVTGNGLNETFSEVDPAVVFPHVGDYQITLLASNLDGCKASVTKNITVKTEFNVYIPSSFTPNGDGLNEIFFPVFTEYGLDDASYEMLIFDRWDNLLFQTKNKNQGWDGKKSGQVVKEDMYIYRIKFKDLNGNVYIKTGNVTIIK